LRLRRARILLSEGDTTVAEVASAVGYGSVSQFSREYRRTFGLSPGQDAARLRAGHSASDGDMAGDVAAGGSGGGL
jgi:transcriptional regulator GlxA family with amidase domain